MGGIISRRSEAKDVAANPVCAAEAYWGETEIGYLEARSGGRQLPIGPTNTRYAPSRYGKVIEWGRRRMLSRKVRHPLAECRQG